MRRDVEYEVFYAIDLINEAETLMTDKNMDLCGDPVECRRLLDEHTDHDWLVSTYVILIPFCLNKP